MAEAASMEFERLVAAAEAACHERRPRNADPLALAAVAIAETQEETAGTAGTPHPRDASAAGASDSRVQRKGGAKGNG